MNTELIKQAKENLAQFKCMSKEMQDLFESIGKKNFKYLASDGKWFEARINPFSHDNIYRLRQDYEPKPEKDYVDIEAKEDAQGYFHIEFNDIHCYATDADGKKGFLGYVHYTDQYPEGLLCNSFTMYVDCIGFLHMSQYEGNIRKINRATHVRFERGK